MAIMSFAFTAVLCHGQDWPEDGERLSGQNWGKELREGGAIDVESDPSVIAQALSSWSRGMPRDQDSEARVSRWTAWVENCSMVRTDIWG